MNRVLIIVVVLLIIAGIVGGGAILLSKKNPAPTTTTTSTTSTTSKTTTPATTTPSTSTSSNSVLTADPVAVGAAATQRYNAAVQKLQSWASAKQNAQFSGLFITFTPTLELNSATEVYVFDSPDDTANHYAINVSQSTGNMLRAIIPTADFQGTLKPIDRSFWQSNYVEAIQFAEKNGGKEFRTANSIVDIEANLLRTTPKDFLYWVVTYHTKDPTLSKTIKMDAKSKTLVTE